MAQRLQFRQRNHVTFAERPDLGAPERGHVPKTAENAADIARQRPHIGSLAAFGLENGHVGVRGFDQGERAYDLAREGEVVELAARPVTIHRLELIETPDSDHGVFEAECGKGAYVRGLARDMGRALGCFGHVSALRRTAVGPFGEPDMISLEDLQALWHRAAAGEASLADALEPVETALDDIPALAVSRADAARLQRGQAVLLRGRDAPIFRGTVYVTVSGQLVALAEVDRGEIVPKRVFNLAGLVGSAGP